MKKILILGGTQFVGRQLVEQLSKRGDLSLTIVHRGKTNPGIFPELQHIIADRNNDDLKALTKQSWDTVVDFSCYYPAPLRNLLTGLKGRVGRYIFISTVSVYDMDALEEAEAVTESSPLLTCSEEQEVDTTLYTYGQRKVACENAVLSHPNMNPLILRPGLIYGKYDPTDRFYYWLWRYKKCSQIVHPQIPEQRLQWTYAPDFSRLIERAIDEAMPRKIYQTLTHGPVSFKYLLNALSSLFDTHPELKAITHEQMQEKELHFWQDFPITLPEERLFDQSTMADFKLNLKTFKDTLRESSQYYESLGWPTPKTGISVEKERELFHLL